jgi:hypothetical protein
VDANCRIQAAIASCAAIPCDDNDRSHEVEGPRPKQSESPEAWLNLLPTPDGMDRSQSAFSCRESRKAGQRRTDPCRQCQASSSEGLEGTPGRAHVVADYLLPRSSPNLQAAGCGSGGSGASTADISWIPSCAGTASNPYRPDGREPSSRVSDRVFPPCSTERSKGSILPGDLELGGGSGGAVSR